MRVAIYIIIPIYNRIELTINCLASIYRSTYKNFKIVIVDDGSTDGSSNTIDKEYPEINIIKGNGNWFWTKSINEGIKFALKKVENDDVILTLNNDTEVHEKFLEKMIYWHDKKNNSLLGALDINIKTKKPHFGGNYCDWKNCKTTNVLETIKGEDFVGLHVANQLPGRGLLIPPSIIDKIGLFDEKKLPHYFADYEYSIRAYQNEIETYCNYDAIVYTYPEESGDFEIRSKKNLKNFYNHLFHIKGGGNLRNFTIYVINNCPKKYLVQNLLYGYSKRILGYWLK